MTIEFRVGPMKFEPRSASVDLDAYDKLLGINAELEILAAGKSIYREPEMPIVELAAALSEWRQCFARGPCDFDYVTMESDERGFVWIHRTDRGLRVGSIHQIAADETGSTAAAVLQAVDEFIDRVKRDVLSQLQVDVRDLIDADAPRA
jgi:hypothetical protein